MTENETKFALTVESVMNNVPVPEYRQLLVEAISIFCGLVEMDKDNIINLQSLLKIDDIVAKANKLFLEDQVSSNQSIYGFYWVLIPIYIEQPLSTRNYASY